MLTSKNAEPESFRGSSTRGHGTPSVVYLDGALIIEFNDLKSRVIRIGGELDVSIVYRGVNSVNCDAVEKQLHNYRT
jgi:hypothetical protein